jgi:hypothetical protein
VIAVASAAWKSVSLGGGPRGWLIGGSCCEKDSCGGLGC